MVISQQPAATSTGPWATAAIRAQQMHAGAHLSPLSPAVPASVNTAAPKVTLSVAPSGPAPLPDPIGPQAPPRQVQQTVNNLLDSQYAGSFYEAYALLERIARQGQEAHATLLRNSRETLNYGKRHEADHALDQVRGQNKSAKVNAIGLGGTTLLTIAGSMAGVGFNLPSLGQFATQFTQIVQPMINVVDRHSATLGGTYHSNLANLAMKDDAITINSGTNAETHAREAKEAGADFLRSLKELFNGHFQRTFDTLDRMAH